MYLFKKGPNTQKPRVQLLGSGTIFIEVIAAASLLQEDWGIEADLWSCPSFTELGRDGQSCERWNRLHPTETARITHVERCLAEAKGPVIAATDYMRNFAEQIRPWVKQSYTVLGTDGFGRSDTRANLRSFFEVDRYHVTVAALYALSQTGEFDAAKVEVAMAKYNINPEASAPWLI
jgi:pyruvate dehydrogenase E1 component